MQPKILLVDDREDNLLSIEAILEADGYHFFKAYSGSQALKILLSEFDFAMILMDVKMPILNGFETATMIYEREKLRHIPIIFITANNYGDENVFKGYQAGGIDYIFKPINPDVLRAKVAVFIELYRKNALLHEQEQKLSVVNENLESEIKALRASNAKLVKDIDNLESMLTSSKLSIEPSELVNSDLNELLNGVLADMADQVKEKMATVSIEPLPSLRVSPSLMRPLFKKLIGNALQSSKKNIQPIVKIRSEIGLPSEINSKSLASQKYCSIVIEDNGVGFDQKKAEQIFSSTEKLPRNGELNHAAKGLVLCKNIIDQHHGFISARSGADEGSAIIISLPMP